MGTKQSLHFWTVRKVKPHPLSLPRQIYSLCVSSISCAKRGEMGSSKDDSATDGDNSGGEVPDSDSSLFSEGEKVLAYHGPRIYEAKVLLLLLLLLFTFSLPFSFSPFVVLCTLSFLWNCWFRPEKVYGNRPFKNRPDGARAAKRGPLRSHTDNRAVQ